MEFNNVYFHNIEQMEYDQESKSYLLYRFDQKIRPMLGYRHLIKGQEKCQLPVGSEIRFIYDGDSAIIQLFPFDDDIYVTCYIGDFEHSRVLLKKGIVNDVVIQKHNRFLKINVGNEKKRRFSSNLFRVLIEDRSRIGFVSVTSDSKICLPTEIDMPKSTFLAYGSSITQGVGTFSNQNSYLQTFANLANVDVLNKGMSGCCLCEKEMVDYLMTIQCDYYLYELGANMRGVMDENEFERRVRYLFSMTSSTHPDKKIFVIDMLDFFNVQYKDYEGAEYKERSILYSLVLNKIVHEYPNIILFESSDLLKEFTCVSADMLHPSEYGHHMMGYLLANKIKNYL